MRILVFVFLVLIGKISGQKGSEFNYQIYKPVINEILTIYPNSRLIDIYKHLFQSRFGPEHFLSDSLTAFAILKEELKSEEIKSYKQIPDSILILILKPEKKYIRVDLSLVKDRIIPLNLYFSAFYQSSTKIDTVELEKWKKDWNELIKNIERDGLKIKNFSEDNLKIQTAFKNNKFVFSHSAEYKKLYHPHYRLIEINIFKNFLLPYLKPYRLKITLD